VRYNPQTMKTAANGITTRYELEGPPSAPIVTLSHSLAANLHLWDAQAAALKDRYRVLRYDIRGHVGYGDMREDIRAIRCPTLILVGEEDRGTDITMARAMYERIAGSELTVIPKAAHCACVEAAEEFNRAVRGFLARVR
jgi:pimeloyl-ACP methyl ester carboxylesterase